MMLSLKALSRRSMDTVLNRVICQSVLGFNREITRRANDVNLRLDGWFSSRARSKTKTSFRAAWNLPLFVLREEFS